MFSQALFTSSVIASVSLGTSISTSFAQNNDSDFIKIRNSPKRLLLDRYPGMYPSFHKKFAKAQCADAGNDFWGGGTALALAPMVAADATQAGANKHQTNNRYATGRFC